MLFARLTPWLLLACLTLKATAADWPSWRGPNKNGTTSEAVAHEHWPNEGPKVLWKAKVGVGFASITIANERAFTAGNVNKSDTVTLWCLQPASGKTLWSREWPSPLKPTMYEGGPNASPVVDGDHVYFVVKPARIVCLKAATGESIWEKDLAADSPADMSSWGIIGSPLIHESMLILSYGTLGTALDKNTGKILWFSGPGQAGWNTPAIAGKNQDTLVVFATNQVAAVQLKDGKALWGIPFGEGYFCHSADPLINGDTFYVGSMDHGGLVVRLGEKPETLWKNRAMGNFMVGSIVRNQHLYGINNCDVKDTGAALKCVAWETGKVVWEEKGFGWGSLIGVADDKVVLLNDKGEVSIARLSPEKFQLLARFQAIGGKCWTPPSLANGRLFIRNAAGDVVCLDVAPPKAG